MIVVDRRPAPERLLAALDARPDRAAARLLAPFGSLFAGGARLRRRLLAERPLPADPPNLGIGNLRVGGTGKTPVVEDLGRRLVAEGHSVGVLTRGYRGSGGGDEPGWLGAAGLRVYADPDRRRGLERARVDGVDRVLLDDALQTRYRPAHLVALMLDRDLRREPRPLPAGPAREGPESLQRADAWFVRREAAEDAPLPDGSLGFRLRPEGLFDADGRPLGTPDGPGVLFCGLARPESFEADAVAFGLEVRGSWREPDHWAPGPDTARELGAFARDRGARWFVVPEKNLARLAGVDLEKPVYTLRSRVHWDDAIDPLAWLRARGIRI